MSKTISEVQEAKEKAQKEITDILNKLQLDTGTHVTSLNIRILPIYHGIINIEAVVTITL